MNKLKQRIFSIIQIGNKEDFISFSFDILIVATIVLNISVMFLQTFDELSSFYKLFSIIEKVTLVIFCIEYALRIWTSDLLYPNISKKKAIFRFLFSFDGIIDFLTILPFFFLSGFIAFRMLRVVRILHLFRINAKYDSFNVITSVLYEKKNQILSSIFIILILMMASSLGMYSAEHHAQPEAFKNAFSGIWWSVSTLLTVGYGDIYPITTLGRVMAILIAFLGVGVVAIPTGIISAGFVEQYTKIKTMTDIEENHDIRFITFKITKTHSWKNKKIKDINIPEGVIVALILRNEEVLVPSGNLSILEKDEIVLGARNFSSDNDDIKLKEISLKKGNSNIGKKIKDLDISRQTIIVTIKRQGRVIIPKGDTSLKENDTLLVYSKSHLDNLSN